MNAINRVIVAGFATVLILTGVFVWSRYPMMLPTRHPDQAFRFTGSAGVLLGRAPASPPAASPGSRSLSAV